jgi:DNA-binding NarL/FixJ family response regulator
MRRARILIAEDHTIVMEGLTGLLKVDFDVVGAVSDGRMLVDAAKRLRPDVVVTDISMPGMNGLEACRQLRAEGIEAKVIFLTMHGGQLATEALQAGASGFLLKHSAGEELVTAIREVLQGHVYLTPAVIKDVIAGMSAGQPIAPPALTPRQREVLRFIVEGRRMKEIGALLDLSPRTVETHKYEMMQTLGVKTTAELIRYAIEHHLAGG